MTTAVTATSMATARNVRRWTGRDGCEAVMPQPF
jgi:hypothetical protein